MSGPKISSYELEQRREEALRRKYMEEQRRKQEEERRRQEEERKRQEHFRQQKQFRDTIDTKIRSIRSLKDTVLPQFRDIINDTRCRINHESYSNLDGETQRLNAQKIQLFNQKEISQKEYDAFIHEANRINAEWLSKEKELSGERMVLNAASFMESMRSIQKMNVVDSKPEKDEEQKRKEQIIVRQTCDLYEEACQLLSDALTEFPKRSNEIHQYMNALNYRFRETQDTPQEMLISIQQKLEDIKAYISRWKDEKEKERQKNEKRKEWLNLYRYYCRELRKPLMSVEELDSLSDKDLESLCVRLDEELFVCYEENYIYQCIEEAMAEIGYKHYGTANNGTKGQFLFQMHDQTMVHVSYTEDGTISMEIGLGTDEKERKLSNAELGGLVGDMETFCTDYARIQSILDQKGVLLKKDIVLAPAGIEYAATIDTSQYDRCAEAQERYAERKEEKWMTMPGEQ